LILVRLTAKKASDIFRNFLFIVRTIHVILYFGVLRKELNTGIYFPTIYGILKLLFTFNDIFNTIVSIDFRETSLHIAVLDWLTECNSWSLFSADAMLMSRYDAHIIPPYLRDRKLPRWCAVQTFTLKIILAIRKLVRVHLPISPSLAKACCKLLFCTDILHSCSICTYVCNLYL